MSLVQYTFHIIPTDGISDLPIEFNSEENNDGFDDSLLWLKNQTDRSFFKGISAILPEGKSWSEEIDLYGDQESNCLQVLFENKKVVSVSFRIDYISQYEYILDSMVEFCIMNGVAIVDEQYKLVSLNHTAIKQVIEDSHQYNMYKKLSE